MISQILFLVISGIALYFAFIQFRAIRRKILLGKKPDNSFEDKKERWKQVLLIALGQKKMFKRPIPAIFHLFIYLAFIVTQVELIEVFIDGIFGTHRFFLPYLSSFYPFVISLIEVLSLLALIATFIFLARRNLLKVPRFHMDEMTGWPKLDGNIILYLEILLVLAIFTMNGADIVLQGLNPEHYHHTGRLAVSSSLGPMLFGSLSVSSLVFLERLGWWLHFVVVLGFLNYLPISKHLHLILAFPNTWYKGINNRGKMKNMPEIMKEVQSMMGLIEEPAPEEMSEELPEFGANDIMNLPWTDLLAAYTCTECGRCSSVCPANITGKKLSPRKIMMDVRDRTEEVFLGMKEQSFENPLDYKDDKSLFDYITKEEIHACTSCNACVEACPVLINPVDIIFSLRRYEVLTLSEGPKDWLPLFNSIENSGSAWQISKSRLEWNTDLK